MLVAIDAAFPTAAVVWPLGTITGRLVAVVASCLLPHICDALNKVALNLRFSLYCQDDANARFYASQHAFIVIVARKTIMTLVPIELSIIG